MLDYLAMQYHYGLEGEERKEYHELLKEINKFKEMDLAKKANNSGSNSGSEN